MHSDELRKYIDRRQSSTGACVSVSVCVYVLNIYMVYCITMGTDSLALIRTETTEAKRAA